MILTSPVTLPSLEFASVSLTTSQVVARTRSPFSARAQVYQHQGQLWRASIDLPPLHREDADPWLAILADLSSGAGTFHLGDPAKPSPRGTWSGTPLINGASQTGQSLDVDGFNVSETGVAKAGDYFQLGSGEEQRLYQVVEDADSNASGEATLKIWPRLRETPSDNTAIVTSNPMGTFELVEDHSWAWDVAQIARISFEAVEAI